MYMHHQDGGRYGHDRITVTKLILMETGTYGRQYRRPYETNINGNILNALGERIAGASAAEITPSTFTGIANQMLKPSATPESEIHIENGWNERRVRFLMELEYSNGTGVTRAVQVLGSTDHLGITTSAVDPELVFTINSITTLRVTHARTPQGISVHRNVVHAHQVLAKQSDYGNTVTDMPNLYNQHREYRLRPADVFATMGRTHLSIEDQADVLDTRTMVTHTPTRSERSNNLATNFAADMVSQYRSSADQFALGGSQQQVYGNARTRLMEESATQEPFMAAIAQLQGVPGGINTFRYRHLLSLDPTVDDRTVIIFMDSKAKTLAHWAGQSEDWGSTTYETQTATILAQAIPCLMAECGLTGLKFQVTNDTIDSMPVFQPLGAESFSNMDLGPLLDRFWQRFMFEVLQDITFNNGIMIYLTVTCELHGETIFDISIDGKETCRYAVPQFADARLTPLVTTNEQRSLALAMDFQQVFEQINIPEPAMFNAGNQYGY